MTLLLCASKREYSILARYVLPILYNAMCLLHGAGGGRWHLHQATPLQIAVLTRSAPCAANSCVRNANPALAQVTGMVERAWEVRSTKWSNVYRHVGTQNSEYIPPINGQIFHPRGRKKTWSWWVGES